MISSPSAQVKHRVKCWVKETDVCIPTVNVNVICYVRYEHSLKFCNIISVWFIGLLVFWFCSNHCLTPLDGQRNRPFICVLFSWFSITPHTMFKNYCFTWFEQWCAFHNFVWWWYWLYLNKVQLNCDHLYYEHLLCVTKACCYRMYDTYIGECFLYC